jgi:FkbM family methyltransferase
MRSLRPPPAELSPAEQPLPVDLLDLAVQDLVRRVPAVVFVQVGAHDGKTFDPIRPYVLQHGWTGVVVEPQPRIFGQLQANYAGQPGIRLENCAVGPEDGRRDLFVFAENSGLPEHASMLASFGRENLVNNTHGYRANIEAISVPTLTPRTLLRQCGLTSCNLLQIDTEGFDFVILMEFLRAGIFPELIHFESAACTHDQRNTFLREFHQHGYRVTTIGIDTLAYRQPGGGEFAERVDSGDVRPGRRLGFEISCYAQRVATPAQPKPHPKASG